MASDAPRSTWSHWGSEKALDQRVAVLPSVAALAGYAALSVEDAVVGMPWDSRAAACARPAVPAANIRASARTAITALMPRRRLRRVPSRQWRSLPARAWDRAPARMISPMPSPSTSSPPRGALDACLLYTSDAADDLLCVDLGGRRIIK